MVVVAAAVVDARAVIAAAAAIVFVFDAFPRFVGYTWQVLFK